MYTGLITIVLTTYNRAHLIGETLDSIINQTYSNWKCIIIDDNSVDSTKDIVDGYLHNDNRFRFHIKSNKYPKGLSASRNMGMDLIEETDYIQFFDDDDIMHPQKLEIQISELEDDKTLDLTIFPTVSFKNGEEFEIKKVDPKVKSVRLENIGEDFILLKNIFTAQVPLIRYSYINDERFNESLFYAEEWELFNRLFFTKATQASYVNIPLYYHRKHEMSITANLYGKSNKKEVSNNLAFINVYNVIKKSNSFNGKVFTRFITFALNNKVNDDLLDEIKEDLKSGLFSNKSKEILILFFISCIGFNKSIVTKIIHRIARW
jgi:glycosyltransferase involved in cell wall biosynthesis